MHCIPIICLYLCTCIVICMGPLFGVSNTCSYKLVVTGYRRMRKNVYDSISCVHIYAILNICMQMHSANLRPIRNIFLNPKTGSGILTSTSKQSSMSEMLEV